MISGIDFAIIIAYFVIVMGVGLYASRKASGSIEEYFLGGRHFPWWILGLVGMATFIDMSGTMFQVSYFYMLGVKGYWVCYQGAIAMLLSFLMIFMGKWLNRSKCMTNAELMSLRFGHDVQGQFARILSAVSIIVIVVAFLGYFFVGAAKFLPMFLPIPRLSLFSSSSFTYDLTSIGLSKVIHWRYAGLLNHSFPLLIISPPNNLELLHPLP